jgi:hypothetical protein
MGGQAYQDPDRSRAAVRFLDRIRCRLKGTPDGAANIGIYFEWFLFELSFC